MFAAMQTRARDVLGEPLRHTLLRAICSMYSERGCRDHAGFAFDRHWVVVREADGKFITQRQVAWKLAAIQDH